MPSLGADMEAGTLLEWRIRPGDRVHRGDVVAVIDTDKAEIEVEIFSDGVVDQLLVEPGAKVPVGTALARLRADGAAAHAPPPAATPPAPVAAPHRIRVSPLARRMAAERGIDLSTVHGTGEGGAITRADIEKLEPPAARARGAEPPATAIPAAEPSPPPAAAKEGALKPDAERAAQRAKLMRRSIAAAMARSKREIPHYYLSTRVSMESALRWLERENARRPVPDRLLPAALLLKSTALALRQVPELNGFYRDEGFVASDAIHLGVAISLRPSGLVAPALHDADRLTLGECMAALRALVARARAGVLRSSELSDATITVTNVGDQGSDAVFGVIYPPQVALVGFGRIREEPWAANGMLGAHRVVTASLAADHRASDGHRGGLFLAALDRLLQTPEAL
jgi:pyruvate dehydrogenase E2 component (dihydrolipoamide acetyltransferase)